MERVSHAYLCFFIECAPLNTTVNVIFVAIIAKTLLFCWVYCVARQRKPCRSCVSDKRGDMQTPPRMVRFLLRGPGANYCTTVPGHFILNEKMKCRTPGKSFIGPAHSGKVVFTVDLQNLPKNKWCDITRNVVDYSVPRHFIEIVPIFSRFLGIRVYLSALHALLSNHLSKHAPFSHFSHLQRSCYTHDCRIS